MTLVHVYIDYLRSLVGIFSNFEIVGKHLTRCLGDHVTIRIHIVEWLPLVVVKLHSIVLNCEPCHSSCYNNTNLLKR